MDTGACLPLLPFLLRLLNKQLLGTKDNNCLTFYLPLLPDTQPQLLNSMVFLLWNFVLCSVPPIFSGLQVCTVDRLVFYMHYFTNGLL